MTSPYDMHIAAVDTLKQELDRVMEQISAVVERIDIDTTRLASAAIGETAPDDFNVHGLIGQVKDSLLEAIGTAVAAQESADAYRSSWGGRQ